MRLAEFTRSTIDLLLPRICPCCDGALCASDRGMICGTCWARTMVLPAPHCQRCWHPNEHIECGWCKLLPPYIRAVRSWCWYPGRSASAIVGALKYQGWTGAAEEMAERIARLPWPSDVVAERSALVPVPLSPVRQRERGYNQSTLIAEALSRRWGVPILVDCLRRTRSTRSQTRLTPEERLQNVGGAFTVGTGAAWKIRDAHILLVDDVVTTAATLNACAEALYRGGARIISYATFGRAPGTGDNI